MSHLPPERSKQALIPSNLKQAGTTNLTIINVEEYPECDDPVAHKLSPDPVFSPRLKQGRKEKLVISQSIEKDSDSKSKKSNFNDFLTKMEQFQKAKNEKLVNMQAIKKVQEEEKMSNLPKVKMSEMSKKILEDKKRRDGKDFAHSPNPTKEPILKSSSISTKNLKTKNLTEPPSVEKPKIKEDVKEVLVKKEVKEVKTLKDVKSLKDLKDVKDLKDGKDFKDFKTKELPSNPPQATLSPPVMSTSEKVLCSKLVKEINSVVDEVNNGKLSLNQLQTKSEEKLFLKMWTVTGAEAAGELSLENLRTFLLAVMNFYLQSMAHNHPEGNFGRIIEGKLFMNPLEVAKVHKFFELFALNRNSELKKIEKEEKKNPLHKEISKNDSKIQDSIKIKEIELKPENPGKNLPKPSKIEGKTLKIPSPERKNDEKPDQSPSIIVRLKDPNLKKLGNSGIHGKVIEKPRTDVKMMKVHSVKSLTKDREACITPKSRRTENLNTSFRSARSKSRSKVGQDSARSSMSESEWAGINSDKISDPSILLKAQDLLGAFSKPKQEEKKSQKEEVFGKDSRKTTEVVGSKLLFKKNNEFKGPLNKGIDQDLRKAQDMLKGSSRSPAKHPDDIIVEVSMPDGTQKTLIIPVDSNHKGVIQKFVRENGLTNEMGNILLESIR
jgi:hypothetical protein